MNNNNYATVFVYGTLKKGFCNAEYLQDSEYLGPSKTKHPNYSLVGVFSNDYDYPGLLHDGKDYVEGEIYNIDAATLKKLDVLEEVDIEYRRELVQLENGESAWAYFYMEDAPKDFCRNHRQLNKENNMVHWLSSV